MKKNGIDKHWDTKMKKHKENTNIWNKVQNGQPKIKIRMPFGNQIARHHIATNVNPVTKIKVLKENYLAQQNPRLKVSIGKYI